MSTKQHTALSQVAQLSHMHMDEIKALWIKFYGSPPNTYVRTFLEKRLAYQLQVAALDKKESQTIKDNAKRLQTKKAQLETPINKSTAPIPGTILRRLYQGVDYEVVVLAGGKFEYNRQPYGSLSEIAREITGTRWSGPLFFGLRKTTKKGTQKS